MLQPVVAFESLSQEVIGMMCAGLSRLQRCVLGIDDIDVSKGVGRIDAATKCVWTYEGHRITISVGSGAGICYARSKEYDPLADPLARTP